jgi:hypothetical protein
MELRLITILSQRRFLIFIISVYPDDRFAYSTLHQLATGDPEFNVRLKKLAVAGPGVSVQSRFKRKWDGSMVDQFQDMVEAGEKNAQNLLRNYKGGAKG